MTGPGPDSPRILVVDDQEANVRLLEVLLRKWDYTNVTATTDSSQALELWKSSSPDAVLLDLQMPPPDGFAVLEQIRASTDGGAFLPILVLTADSTRETRERALELGASDFLNKPFDPTEVRLRIGNLLETRRLHLELRAHNNVLEERVQARTRDLDQARLETLERLALAAEYRDDNTHEHAQRVGRTCAEIAQALGLTADQVELVRRAAPLHDIGKIGISDTILLKPGKLTDAEFDVMKTHTTIGRDILAGSQSRVLRLSEEIALTHHERWDGTGYPQRLAGEDIPRAGRLVAIADIFDALTHRRPYKEAWPLEAALAELHELAGRHLDPKLVEIFAGLDHEALLARV